MASQSPENSSDDKNSEPEEGLEDKTTEIKTEIPDEETEEAEEEQGTVKEGNIVANSDVPVSNDSEEQEESLKTVELDNLNVDRDQKTTTPKENREHETERKKRGVTKKPTIKLSNRMEYLSRPKKDALTSLLDTRLDGSLPEDAFPSWGLLPLPTKIPFARCPIQVTCRKLGTNLFLPPPANDFDLEDENNLMLPYEVYNSLYDPNLNSYVQSSYVYGYLKKHGFITDSKRVTCPLKEINKYRVYQRRLLAAEAEKIFRDQDEEFRRKRAEGMEARIKRDMQKYHERRTQGVMRRWIKNTVASIKESSMKNQMIRDMKVLNSQIRKQRYQRERVEALEERYQRLFAQHITRKYVSDKSKKEAHLILAKKDARLLEKLCQIQEEKKLKKKEKLEEFWIRKSEWQEEWMEQGKELDKIRDEIRENNIEILKRTGRLPHIFCQKEHKGRREKLPSDANIRDRQHQKDESKESEIKPEIVKETSTDGIVQSPPEEIRTSQQLEEKDAPEKISGKEPLLKSSEPEAEDITGRIKTEQPAERDTMASQSNEGANSSETDSLKIKDGEVSKSSDESNVNKEE